MADAMEDAATQRVTMKQREVMVEFMQENNALATGRFTTADGAKIKARLTRAFSDKMNSVADGATKTPDKWMKCWQDWKSDVKKKTGKIRRHLSGTGGGSACRLHLTPLEEKVLQIMGVTGLDTVDPFDAQMEQQQERRENAVEILNPEPSASGSTDVLNLFPLHEVMNVDELINRSSATAVTVPLPEPSPATSDSTDLSVEADHESQRSQRKRKKSEDDSITRSTEAMENLRNSSEALNRLAAIKENRYQLELRKFNMEVAREERLARKEERELELATRTASAIEAMGMAVTAAMQTFQSYLQNK
ncbi:hypothetical protein ONE63_010316 [Megalurothrips usitatus]|uniref:Regulatory protein zeste n=1 Tax=Megalurothrips usitatus TaxID=439358 RepID=A0AAV7XID3_9NEOP|nr:hypothetical protein ONE63_010316 [Megalurothrips usitatus]